MIEQSAQQNPPVFESVRRPASSWNSFDDPQDIADTEASDVLNIVFDRGYATPRGGTLLAFPKPSGETNALLNLLHTQTSDGVEYAMAIYGPNIYVLDDSNSQWISVNGGYVPTNTTTYYGYQNWCAGRGNDACYFGNGIDATLKWQLGICHLSAPVAGTNVLPVDSSTRFPPTGTLIIQSGTTNAKVSYISNANNVFTLAAPLATAFPQGSSICFAVQNMSVNRTESDNVLTVATLTTDTVLTTYSTIGFPNSGTVTLQNGVQFATCAYTSITGNTITLSAQVGQVFPVGTNVVYSNGIVTAMPKGRIFAKYQQRLVIANSFGYETTMWYSNVGSPEDFSIDVSPAGGGYDIFYEGSGPITGVLDFGIYLAILKQDTFMRFEFVVSADNTTKIDQITPLISDKSMGAAYVSGWMVKNRVLYYVTSTEGIISISPVITGFQTTINLAVLSQKIQPTVLGLNFSNTRVTSLFQKLLFTAATVTANDTVLVYDTLRQYWTKFNNWPVGDWLPFKNALYFGSSQDGSIYKCFDAGNTDNQQPYTSSATTRRFDFGQPSMPKTMTRVYVQGYITPSTNLYCDVMYNEMGQQKTLTYLIAGNNPTAVQPIPEAMAMIMFGLPVFGDDDFRSFSGIGNFRVYLNVPIRLGFYNVQLRFYTNTLASNWSVTGIGFNPRTEALIPSALCIEPNGSVPVPTQETDSI